MGAFATLRWWWVVVGGAGLVVWSLQPDPFARVPKSSTSARAPARAYATTVVQPSKSRLSVDLNVTNMPAIAVHEPRTGVLPQGFLFDPPVLYPTGQEQPLAITVGDISGDGRSDVVAAVATASANNTVLVFRQAEDGTLLAPDRYQYANWATSAALTLVDLDNDGDQEIVIGNQNGMTVLLNGPAGMSVSSQPSATLNGYMGVAALDVNGDGFKDIAAANLEYGTDVFVNNGAGVLTPGQHVATPYGIRQISVADLTDDGVEDLVVQHYKAELLVYPVDSGALGAPIKLLFPVAVTDAQSHVLADFNGDGRLDVGTNEAHVLEQSYVRVFLRTREGKLAAGWTAPTANRPGPLAAADVDGNGRYDLVSMEQPYTMGYFLQGAKGFRPEIGMPLFPQLAHYVGSGFAVGRVLGDDCQDVVAGNTSLGGYAISIFRGRNCSHNPIRTPTPPLSIPSRR